MSDVKYKILVVDDEESLRGILSEVLTDAGFEVECASTAEEALSIVNERKPDVVITDIRMPGMNGIELLEKIKAMDQSIQVVIMTSHASVDTAIQAIRLGAYDYLTKPFEDLDIITTVVERTVERLKLEREVKHLLSMLKRRNDEIETLYNLTAEVAGILNPDELVKKAVDSLSKLCPGMVSYYFSYDSSSNVLKARLASSKPDRDWGELVFEVKGIKSIANYHKVINNDIELKKRMALSPDPASTFLVALEIDKRFIGCFAVADPSGTEIDKGKRDLVAQFVGTVCTQAEKAKLHEQIRALAVRDGLTGLFNHRYFQNTLANELVRAHRFQKPLSILLFDIDNFKHYNDTNGHPAGDQLLRQVGAILNKTRRAIDIVARYGGEEFVMILVETDLKGAQIAAERVRKAIESYPFEHREKQPLGVVSVSIGVACYPVNALTKSELIEAADEALYRAKEEGRNRVCMSERKASSNPDPSSPPIK